MCRGGERGGGWCDARRPCGQHTIVANCPRDLAIVVARIEWQVASTPLTLAARTTTAVRDETLLCVCVWTEVMGVCGGRLCLSLTARAIGRASPRRAHWGAQFETHLGRAWLQATRPAAAGARHANEAISAIRLETKKEQISGLL